MMINKKYLSIVAFCCTVFILFNNLSWSSSVIEPITISSSLKENILHSSLKAELRTRNGNKLIAYLYAEDEVREMRTTDTCDDNEKTAESKTGHYYIYLYDIGQNLFYPYRTKVFKEFGDTTFDVQGADLIVLSGSKMRQSDVLLISQFAACICNEFEAFGFYEDKPYLQNFIFVGKKRQPHFCGKVGNSKRSASIYAYTLLHHRIQQMSLSISKKQGEIRIKPEDI